MHRGQGAEVAAGVLAGAVGELEHAAGGCVRIAPDEPGQPRAVGALVAEAGFGRGHRVILPFSPT